VNDKEKAETGAESKSDQPPKSWDSKGKLVRLKNLPNCWADQRAYLGFPAA